MQNKIINILKATIIKLVVAFLFIGILFLLYNVMLKEKFETVAELIDIFAVNNQELKTVEPLLDGNMLLNKPIYGSNYATLKIPSIGVDLPIYYGESLSLLKYGIGHDRISYFPGEGGTIVYMGHNFKTFLAKLPQAKIGDLIEVHTQYGTFDYTIYETKIVHETDVNEVQIQQKEERLVIYTCYPINNIGHAYQRYLVFAK